MSSKMKAVSIFIFVVAFCAITGCASAEVTNLHVVPHTHDVRFTSPFFHQC